MVFERNKALDGIKAAAIIAVVFYHLGVLQYGYLGVDIFFVISGFLTTESIYRKKRSNSFHYILFLLERFQRIMPLIFVAGLVCLLAGYVGMLPDDYENLCESIVASNFASENILSAITTKNYWDVVNDYKPLMHLWYVGVLAEFYITYPVLLAILDKMASKMKNSKIFVGGGVTSFAVISLVLYILPFPDTFKFYYLPCRFFEFGLGGVLLFVYEGYVRSGRKNGRVARYIAAGFLLILMFTNAALIPVQIRLLAVCVATAAAILFLGSNDKLAGNKTVSAIGKRSYSIFIWHQILLAFYRYYVTNRYGIWFIVVYLAAVFLISEISYRLVEVRFSNCRIRTVAVVSGIAGIISTAAGLWVYLHAGVVRDIPELDIRRNDVHHGMHAEYNDRIYSMNKDFEDNRKTNILIIGDSFARDMANIILESGYADAVNISYSYSMDEDLVPRVMECDRLLVFEHRENIPEFIYGNLQENAEMWGIGTKNFGESNGIIYKNRFRKNYFEQTATPDEKIRNENDKRKRSWGEFYIDLMKPVENEDGSVRVFTEDNRFISQDCRHLTRGGAEYYAQVLDLESIIE